MRMFDDETLDYAAEHGEDGLEFSSSVDMDDESLVD